MTNKIITKKTEIKIKAYAKINLFLDITGVLPNGYHSLNNIMQQIDLFDKVGVSFEDAKETSIKICCDNPQIPCDERNIAFKAAELFLKKAGITGSVTVGIEKHIPVMAGLGGSSTDGAAVLKALNKVQNCFFAQGELEEMGACLGADVPFCLRGGAAFCRGIGDKMSDIPFAERCSFVVAKPDFSCNTKRAYGLYDKNPPKIKKDPAAIMSALEKGDVKAVGKELYNVFETLYNDSRIEKIKEELISAGAVGAALSGSGSAVFGVFEDINSAALAKKKMKYPFVGVYRSV